MGRGIGCTTPVRSRKGFLFCFANGDSFDSGTHSKRLSPSAAPKSTTDSSNSSGRQILMIRCRRERSYGTTSNRDTRNRYPAPKTAAEVNLHHTRKRKLIPIHPLRKRAQWRVSSVWLSGFIPIRLCVRLQQARAGANGRISTTYS
jgi:hypothetical protein